MQCAINSTLAVRWNENNRTTTDGGLHVSGMNGRYMHVHISNRNLFPLWSETHYFSYDFISKRDLFLHQKFIHLIFSWPRWKYFTSSLRMPSCVVIVLDQAVVWWWPNKVLLITINGSDTITTVGRRRHHRRTFFSCYVVSVNRWCSDHVFWRHIDCIGGELNWIVIVVSGDVKMLWHFGYIQFFSVIWSHSLLCKSYDLIIF